MDFPACVACKVRPAAYPKTGQCVYCQTEISKWRRDPKRLEELIEKTETRLTQLKNILDYIRSTE